MEKAFLVIKEIKLKQILTVPKHTIIGKNWRICLLRLEKMSFIKIKKR